MSLERYMDVLLAIVLTIMLVMVTAAFTGLAVALWHEVMK